MMEKRNIIETGRTLDNGAKLAEDMDKVAEASEFHEFKKVEQPQPQEPRDEEKTKP